LQEAANVFAFSVPQVTSRGNDVVVIWTSQVDGNYGVESAAVPVSLLK